LFKQQKSKIYVIGWEKLNLGAASHATHELEDALVDLSVGEDQIGALGLPSLAPEIDNIAPASRTNSTPAAMSQGSIFVVM